MSILASSLSLSNTHAEHTFGNVFISTRLLRDPIRVSEFRHTKLCEPKDWQSQLSLEDGDCRLLCRFQACVFFHSRPSVLPTPTPKSFPILLFEFAISDPSWPRKLNYLKVRLDATWLASWGLQFLSSSPVYFLLCCLQGSELILLLEDLWAGSLSRGELTAGTNWTQGCLWTLRGSLSSDSSWETSEENRHPHWVLKLS